MRRRVIVAAVVVAVVVIGALVLRPDSSDPFAAAVALAADDARFESGLEAGESFRRVGLHLNDAIRECDDALGARCQAYGIASGYAQVLAAHVVRCTAPGRDAARRDMAALLAQVDLVTPTSETLPAPPPLTVC